ncbi:hypothetical protein EJ02DRAFT_387814 [Clathrospora elynae]|uniref:Chitin-binding type-4 domain-containing protein n=1 Tax=Clathrospora elynae TaxID=706981 RepID=A0A6A5S969_9PLEO|nr:hypothetical protein EJ02DRAFT_387814 [Clathrospora elynae]
MTSFDPRHNWRTSNRCSQSFSLHFAIPQRFLHFLYSSFATSGLRPHIRSPTHIHSLHSFQEARLPSHSLSATIALLRQPTTIMKSFTAIAAIAGFASSVAAHGYISSPAPRMPGDGLKAACGDQVFSQQSSDHFGNIQGSLQNLQGSHPDCHMWQCKGVPFEDAGKIFEYTAGQVIPMTVEIRAPHDGVANVSIVKISSDTVVGKPLISWDQYALTSSPMSAHPDWTSFNITMPDVSSECANAGDCVIQWYWDAAKINQTYESCIDFKMGGGSGSSPAPSAPASSAAPVKSATPYPTAPQASATPTPTKEVAAPTATTGSGEGSDSTLPKTFTVDTFVTWLRANAGSDAADKVRRMIAAQRPHPRAFRV